MTAGPNSHDASVSLQYGYMVLSNTNFDARVGYVGAGTLMGIVGSKRAGKGILFNANDGLLPVHRNEGNA